MEFEYAATLKTAFRVLGDFYHLDVAGESVLCRRRVEILTSDMPDVEANRTPDAVAILMNPGSLRLVDEAAWQVTERQPLDTARLQALKPDNTQYQLMRLMRLQQWRHLRLLNLSDVCDADSQSFARRLKALLVTLPDCPHSVLHPQRQDEWERLIGNGPVMAAWGSNAVLEPQALACLARVPDIIGVPTTEPWFRFASPYRKDQKLLWLEQMQQQLQTPVDVR